MIFHAFGREQKQAISLECGTHIWLLVIPPKGTRALPPSLHSHFGRGHSRASTYYDQKILEKENVVFYCTMGQCFEVTRGIISGKRPNIVSVCVQ